MAKYSMRKIEEDYGNFVSPAFTVKINGSVIPQKYCTGEIEIELSADYEASGCTIRIYNAFIQVDNERLELASDIKRLMKLGNKIEIAIGYRGHKAEDIFVGYIDGLSMEFEREAGAILLIECLDGKGIMMNSRHSESKVSIKKYSDAVEKTVKKYSSLIKISTTNIDKSDREVGMLIEQHNESDYNFVVRVAKKLGYCFFIDRGKLIFKPFSKLSKEVIFAFDMNEYILLFQMESTLKDQVSSVTVRANNEKNPNQPFESKVEQCKSIVDNTSVKMNSASLISKDVSQVIVDYSAASEEETKKIAEAKLQALSYHRYSGKIKTLGVPVLTAGIVVEVKGFCALFDKKYFVRKVKHRISDHKYTTECELEGNQT